MAREFAASNRVGEDTTSNLVLHVPLRSTLSLPGPVQPAAALLIRIELGLDEAADVVTVSLGHAGDSADRLASATADGRATGVSTVVASTDALTVQVLGAVCHGAGPLADDGPLVGGEDVVVHEAAGCGGVLGCRHGEQTVVEDFVVVGIHHDVVDAGRGAHEAVPGLRGHEPVVQDDGGVLTCLAGDTPGVVVVLLQGVFVHTTGNVGLVQGLDGGDDICVAGVPFRKRRDGALGLGDGVALLPVNGTTLSTVVESVLGTGSCMLLISMSSRTDDILCTLTTVQVNDNLQAGSASPVHCIVKVRQLSTDVRVFRQVLQSPVADGNSDMVHARGRDLIEVILGDEGAPVLGQNRTAIGRAQGRA